MENNFTRGVITQNFGWPISSWFMKEKQFEIQNLEKIWPRVCKKTYQKLFDKTFMIFRKNQIKNY